MLNHTILIDNSYFIFDCVTISDSLTKTVNFTYKLEPEKTISGVMKKYFEFLKEISNDQYFNKILLDNKNYHFHSIYQKDQLDLIEKIYLNVKENKFSKKWINQNILNGSNIWQVKLEKNQNDDGSRLVFIKLDLFSDNLTIIKPLLIDINHLVYPDKKLNKTYGKCLVCHKSSC